MKYLIGELLLTLSEIIDNIERIIRRIINANNTKGI
jgi:hypothetical protein